MSRPVRPSDTIISPDPIASSVASIRRLVRALRLTARRTQAVSGITAAQLFVLQQLKSDTSLSLNELAARTLTDRSSVADVVDRLEAQHLVDRAVDPSDRRRAAIRITAGWPTHPVPRARRAHDHADAALKALSPRDRALLAESLIRLNTALGAADAPATMLFADDVMTEGGTRKRR